MIHRYTMPGRKSENVLVKGNGAVSVHRRQVFAYPHLVEPARHARQAKKGFDLGGENKHALGGIVVEGLDPEVVSSAKQDLLAPIPEGKGKISQQLLRAVLPPFFIGGQDQLTVGNLGRRTGSEAERSQELIPVIDAGIRRENEVTRVVE